MMVIQVYTDVWLLEIDVYNTERLYIERLIHSSEKVLNVYVGFSGNDYLCLKDNYILKKIAQTVWILYDCRSSSL